MIKYHSSWENFISNSKYLDSVLKFVNNTKDICPCKEKVFRFLDSDVKKAKCIVLGMDPYPSIYKHDGKTYPVATGRAFEVANVSNWTDKYRQTSLAAIFKTLCYMKFGTINNMDELREKVNETNFPLLNIHKWFDKMEEQGVIFLNSTLTTIVNKSNAHEKIWKVFMDELLKYIVSVNTDLLWLIWGNNAKDRVSGIVAENKMIYTCHPASRVNNTFVKDKTFESVKSIKWV